MASTAETVTLPSSSDHFGVIRLMALVATRLPRNAPMVASVGPIMNMLSVAFVPSSRSGIMALSTVVVPVPVVRMRAQPMAAAIALPLLTCSIVFPSSLLRQPARDIATWRPRAGASGV